MDFHQRPPTGEEGAGPRDVCLNNGHGHPHPGWPYFFGYTGEVGTVATVDFNLTPHPL